MATTSKLICNVLIKEVCLALPTPTKIFVVMKFENTRIETKARLYVDQTSKAASFNESLCFPINLDNRSETKDVLDKKARIGVYSINLANSIKVIGDCSILVPYSSPERKVRSLSLVLQHCPDKNAYIDLEIKMQSSEENYADVVLSTFDKTENTATFDSSKDSASEAQFNLGSNLKHYRCLQKVHSKPVSEMSKMMSYREGDSIEKTSTVMHRSIINRDTRKSSLKENTIHSELQEEYEGSKTGRTDYCKSLRRAGGRVPFSDTKRVPVEISRSQLPSSSPLNKLKENNGGINKKCLEKLTQLKKEVIEKDTKLESLSKQLTILQEENLNLKNQIKTNNETYEKKIQEMGTAQSIQIATAENNHEIMIKALRVDLDNAKDQISKITLEKAEALDQASKYQNTVEQIRKASKVKLLEFKKLAENSEAKIKELEKNSSLQKEEIDKLKLVPTESQEELTQMRKNYTSMQQSLCKLRDSSRAQQKKFDCEAATLRGQLEEVTLAKRQLLSQRQLLDSKLHEQATRIEQLEVELVKTKMDLGEALNYINDIEDEHPINKLQKN